MAGSAESDGDSRGFKLYHYDPSFGAAVLFAVLFAAASIRHLQVLIKTKTWAFIPFLLGCLCTYDMISWLMDTFADAVPYE